MTATTQTDVARIQTGANAYADRAFHAPRTDDGKTVLLDACPRGTVEVRTFLSVKAAADHMKVSPRTVRRQIAAGEAGEL